jgi:hypothetical protein
VTLHIEVVSPTELRVTGTVEELFEALDVWLAGGLTVTGDPDLRCITGCGRSKRTGDELMTEIAGTGRDTENLLLLNIRLRRRSARAGSMCARLRCPRGEGRPLEGSRVNE